MRQFEANSNVLHVSEKSISYAPEIKLAALNAHQEGKSPQEIFVEAGFHLNIIGNRKAL
jgi:transposase